MVGLDDVFEAFHLPVVGVGRALAEWMPPPSTPDWPDPKDIARNICREWFPGSRTLVALSGRIVGFDRAFYGVLTDLGRRKPLARHCLGFLANGGADAMHG